MIWKKEYICPCGGHFVDPWELGFDSDGAWLICDNEDRGDGSPCEKYVFIDDKEEYLRPNSMNRLWRRIFPKPKIFNIFSEEFHIKALKVSGVHWDFNKVKDRTCAVLGCLHSVEYGYWTCREHRELELKHFDPVDDWGILFYSHRGKEKRLSQDETKKRT